MMGEYLLYARGTLFGGVYDDRFLLKETPASSAALTAQCSPYPGAKPMRLVDVEDRDALVGPRRPEGPGPPSGRYSSSLMCTSSWNPVDEDR